MLMNKNKMYKLSHTGNFKDGYLKPSHIFLRGFTLIELLVVISIIAILMAIMMPALNRVRKMAQEIQCSSNLKQLSLGITLYAADYNDMAMNNEEQRGDFWYHNIARYLSDPVYKTESQKVGITKLDEEQMPVLFCPTGRKLDNLDQKFKQYGTAERAWAYMGGASSYGLNGWISRASESLVNKNPFLIKQSEPKRFKRLSQTTQNTPFVADSVWVSGAVNDFDIAPPSVTAPPPTDSYIMWRFTVARHGKKINVGFSGGDVRSVELQKLWSLKWNKTFRTTDWVEFNDIDWPR